MTSTSCARSGVAPASSAGRFLWSSGSLPRLRSAILHACEQRNEVELGDHGTSTATMADVQKNSWDLLLEEEVFVEAAVNPVNLTLVRWLLVTCATR